MPCHNYQQFHSRRDFLARSGLGLGSAALASLFSRDAFAADTGSAPDAFFDLTDFAHRALFDGKQYVWEAIAAIGEYIDGFFDGMRIEDGILGDVEDGVVIRGERIAVAPGAVIEAGAQIRGRDIVIAEGAVIEAGAYIKGEKV